MELQVFNNTEFGSVRTATVNGEVMFVGKDVADIFYIFMGAGIYGIVSTIMNGIWLVKDSIKKRKAKKKSAEETTEE